MSIIQLILPLVVIFGFAFIPSLNCTSNPAAVSTPPMSPLLIEPTSGSELSGLTIKLQWQTSAGATSYGLQVATDPMFSKLVLEKTEITNAYYELISGLQWKTNYYWRVNAFNASGESLWSKYWSFSTPILNLGKIAFASNRDGNEEIYTMNADGSNQTRITNNQADDSLPTWSPDGTKIVFSSYMDGHNEFCTEIYVIDVDGSNQRRLTNNLDRDEYPTWSPDGTKIAFSSCRDNECGIYVMNDDGSDQTRLTSAIPMFLEWSPDGTKIAFIAVPSWEIYVIDSSGNNQTRITNDSMIDLWLTWSPDSAKIAFASSNRNTTEVDIYVIDSDGSNKTRLTDSAGTDWAPSWR